MFVSRTYKSCQHPEDTIALKIVSSLTPFSGSGIVLTFRANVSLEDLDIAPIQQFPHRR